MTIKKNKKINSVMWAGNLAKEEEPLPASMRS
jgi:hypothetical protein